MSIIPWSDDLSVNVKEIDEQHKAFLGILNNLYKIMMEPESASGVKDILRQLEAYADFHFATEEKYFDKFNYELAAEHKEEHRKLIAKVKEFLKRVDVEGDRVVLELLDFLGDWLVGHLSEQDKKYIKCFNEHGLF